MAGKLDGLIRPRAATLPQALKPMVSSGADPDCPAV